MIAVGGMGESLAALLGDLGHSKEGLGDKEGK
jgi:hypothetical protein